MQERRQVQRRSGKQQIEQNQHGDLSGQLPFQPFAVRFRRTGLFCIFNKLLPPLIPAARRKHSDQRHDSRSSRSHQLLILFTQRKCKTESQQTQQQTEQRKSAECRSKCAGSLCAA